MGYLLNMKFGKQLEVREHPLSVANTNEECEAGVLRRRTLSNPKKTSSEEEFGSFWLSIERICFNTKRSPLNSMPRIVLFPSK